MLNSSLWIFAFMLTIGSISCQSTVTVTKSFTETKIFTVTEYDCPAYSETRCYTAYPTDYGQFSVRPTFGAFCYECYGFEATRLRTPECALIHSVIYNNELLAENEESILLFSPSSVYRFVA